MSTRRRFTADFKALVTLEALRGDRTIQEIASRHKVHPNQVSKWKRQAMDGLSDVFSDGGGMTGASLVARILPDGTRQRTRAFSGLQSHYLFEDRYGRLTPDAVLENPLHVQ